MVLCLQKWTLRALMLHKMVPLMTPRLQQVKLRSTLTLEDMIIFVFDVYHLRILDVKNQFRRVGL